MKPVAVLLIVVFILLGSGALHGQEPMPPPTESATSGLVDDARTPWDGTYRRAVVPILMYHYISTPPADADDTRRGLSVSAELFRAHMEYLYQHGYQAISLYDLDAALNTGERMPAKPVILTFDDGYSDHYTYALPILREFGFTGTFFVITGMSDAANPNHLTWPQIAEMAAMGMEMENHTKEHPELTDRSYDFLVYQIMGAAESLAAYTGRQSRMFAYPVGRYDAYTLSVLETMPVWRAVTTQSGTLQTTDNRLEMPRLRVTGEMSVLTLAALLGGGD